MNQAITWWTLDYYDEKKVAFEKNIATLEQSRKKLDAALYLYPPVKQSIVQSADRRRRRDEKEKEKQWKANLKQREAAKLAQMNDAELERLTWYRNEVCLGPCCCCCVGVPQQGPG